MLKYTVFGCADYMLKSGMFADSDAQLNINDIRHTLFMEATATSVVCPATASQNVSLQEDVSRIKFNRDLGHENPMRIRFSTTFEISLNWIRKHQIQCKMCCSDCWG